MGTLVLENFQGELQFRDPKGSWPVLRNWSDSDLPGFYRVDFHDRSNTLEGPVVAGLRCHYGGHDQMRKRQERSNWKVGG